MKFFYHLSRSVLVASLLAACGLAQAYAKYDLREILVKAESGKKTTSSINLVFLDQVLNDLAQSALYYPVVFADDEEKDRATKDVQTLIKVTKPIASRKSPPTQLLLRLGLLHLLAWNLEIKDSEAAALKYLTLYLKDSPNDGYGNFLLGVYFAGTAAQQPLSIEPLNKAVSLGYNQAYYTLALVYYSLGDKPRTLEYLRMYSAAFPTDIDAPNLIKAIETDQIRIERPATEQSSAQ